MTSYLLINEIVEDEERDIYFYGLHQGLLIIINIMTVFIFGIMIKQMIIVEFWRLY
ncbi:MAG: accessory gene regulator B family protein [Tissierellaceae bacterium]